MIIDTYKLKFAEAARISYAQFDGNLEVRLSACDMPIADGEEIAKFKIKAESDHITRTSDTILLDKNIIGDKKYLIVEINCTSTAYIDYVELLTDTEPVEPTPTPTLTPTTEPTVSPMKFEIEKLDYNSEGVTVLINGDIAVNPGLIVALYDDGGKLVGIRYRDNIASNEIKFDVDITEANKIKAFVWDNIYSLKPLADVKEINISI